MKKSLIIITLFVVALAAFAIPAKRGQWAVITLDDGRQVRVELRGDEHFHYFVDAQGNTYIYDAVSETYRQAQLSEVQRRSVEARVNRAAKLPKRRALNNKETTLFHGEKKGLIILVEFNGLTFRQGHDLELYQKIINEKGYTSNEGFVGSVRDYFYDQSNGQFDLSFDVVGPVKMPKAYSYYGKDVGGEGNDAHPGEMVAKACMEVDEEVDFTTYDWDGDGVVEEVYVLYAGYGQADYYYKDSKVIWPHMYSLSESDYGKTLELDGVTIDVYACSNEVQASGKLAGIGTFCHEFSHCMGFPDMYDTASTSDYYSNYGMGSWDLMCSGSYNGDMFVPAGYSAYEKWECGWIEPIELVNDTTVTDIKPVADGGDAFIIYNKAYPDEAYILENRQKKKWDAQLPGKGMLIQYVDYDPLLWEYNCPNGWESTVKSYYGIDTDHQHLTIFHADNEEYNEAGDTYPYGSNNSLTNNSTPAAKVWHKNTDGSKLMNISVTDIRNTGNGTMAFNFANKGNPDPGPGPDPDPLPDDEGYEVVFYESFNQCKGTGGNDNLFSGSIANYPFTPDIEGWTMGEGAMYYGANKCARFGSSTKRGVVTTPEFEIDGEAELLFRAVPWAKAGTELALSVNGDATISNAELEMQQGIWTNFLLTLTANGTADDGTESTSHAQAPRREAAKTSVSVTFTPAGRFFLDEVKVRKKVEEPVVDGIREINGNWSQTQRIYSIDGRYVGTNLSLLRPGIYIVNGRKVMKK